MYLSVCARDPVYDGVSSFNHPDGYVAEGVKNRISFQLRFGGCYGSAPFSWNLPTERVGGSDAMGWGEIVISTENRAFFQSFCPNPFFDLFFYILVQEALDTFLGCFFKFLRI